MAAWVAPLPTVVHGPFEDKLNACNFNFNTSLSGHATIRSRTMDFFLAHGIVDADGRINSSASLRAIHPVTRDRVAKQKRLRSSGPAVGCQSITSATKSIQIPLSLGHCIASLWLLSLLLLVPLLCCLCASSLDALSSSINVCKLISLCIVTGY